MAAIGTEALIIEAFTQRVAALALALSPVLLVAYPNVTFPAVGQTKPATYLQMSILRAETRGIGLSKWDERAGILQVDVVYSTPNGLAPPTNIADAVAAWFPRNVALVNGGVRVDINEPASIGSPVDDEAPYKKIPVSIRYRVLTP